MTPNFSTSAIAYTITGPKQIKSVLEDKPDACSIELTADIAVAIQ